MGETQPCGEEAGRDIDHADTEGKQGP
jgi:hypothetical protein